MCIDTLCVCVCLYNNNKTKEDAMNLKGLMEGYMEGFGGREGREKNCN